MSTLDNNALIKVALGAVLAGAKIADTKINTQVVSNKGNLRDIVTQSDIEISELLGQKLKATGISVISEESYTLGMTVPDIFWVVDPIDGTVNFAHGLPQYTVSAGLLDNQEFKLGVVCAPALNELYFTLNPQRAMLNGKPFMHVNRMKHDALVAASFGAKSPLPYYAMFQQVNESTRGCLRSGSASLNICWTAVGKLQAAYGFQAKLWDVAGALAIAHAAGCEIVLRQEPNSLLLDYCVGSQDLVHHVVNLAQENKLWD
jgi:myo-inositol-1(or 4)-monophosphatase